MDTAPGVGVSAVLLPMSADKGLTNASRAHRDVAPSQHSRRPDFGGMPVTRQYGQENCWGRNEYGNEPERPDYLEGKGLSRGPRSGSA